MYIVHSIRVHMQVYTPVSIKENPCYVKLILIDENSVLLVSLNYTKEKTENAYQQRNSLLILRVVLQN